MQTLKLNKINRAFISALLALVLLLPVFASCVESDPQQGMPGHMVSPNITLGK
jgi:hypothetical protein